MRNTKPIIYEGSFYLTQKQAERFWSKVEKTPRCWIWKGGINSRYGRMKINGKMIKTHRISFLIHGGILTQEKPFVCHTCDNPICVNPKHLWAGSCDDNLKDMTKKGRSTKGQTLHGGHKGSENGRSKITEQDVIEIRNQFENPFRGQVQMLSSKYGVTRRVIRLIRNRELWNHI